MELTSCTASRDLTRLHADELNPAGREGGDPPMSFGWAGVGTDEGEEGAWY
jgi:hypothetical protein